MSFFCATIIAYLRHAIAYFFSLPHTAGTSGTDCVGLTIIAYLRHAARSARQRSGVVPLANGTLLALLANGAVLVCSLMARCSLRLRMGRYWSARQWVESGDVKERRGLERLKKRLKERCGLVAAGDYVAEYHAEVIERLGVRQPGDNLVGLLLELFHA